jgi:hypothetical protein
MPPVTWRMTACPEHWQELSVGEVAAEDDLIIGSGTRIRSVFLPVRCRSSVVLRGRRRYPTALNDGTPALA